LKLLKPLLKILVSLLVVIAILSAVSGMYEDFLWYKDLGYETLFWTPLFSKFLIQVVNGTMLFLLISATLLSGRHAFATFYNERFRNKLRLVEEINRPLVTISQRRVTLTLLLIAAVISIIVSFIVGFTGWLDVISFFNSSSFHYNDPLFHQDLSFYVFKLPFLLTIYNAFFSPVLILTIFTVFFYVITGVIRFHSPKIWQKDAIVVSDRARKHIGILLIILFLLKAFGYYLETFSLVYTQNGHVIGAGYSDIHASLPVLRILMVLCLIGFVLSIFSVYFKDARFMSVPFPIIMLFSIIFYGIFPSLLQSLVVVPNELQKESPYIENEINLTRYAYGLDKIEEKDYSGTATLTSADLKNNLETLDNVRLNDPRPMMQIYTQKQALRSYYKFNDIDIDRYTVNGEYRQVMLAPREISVQDPDAQTFVNTRFKYTHGFGLTASLANAVTAKGLPAFAVSNIPPQATYPELSITEPRIYFGELTKDWVVVNTKFKEFDYPQGNENAENSYQGKTGITFTPFNKLMLSLHRATPRFYLASEVTANSKILLYRNVIERVQKLAPFLKYDTDPYPVIDNGRIKWIIDAFTTASTIPYSSKYSNQNFNYIRNSVKVVVDAYDGTVDFYAVDLNDPILQTFTKIFPGVFKNISEMPYSLKSHLRYPEMLFKIQCDMLNNFHVTNPKVFYNKEDAWSVAKEVYESNPQNVEPYYVMMKLPGETKSEFILMLPFTPASGQNNTRNNMVSWLAARMDGDNYGKLVLFQLPKNIEIDGPFQIESRIDQDPDISRQLALWNQKGSSVIRGNLLALPIGGNFIFVEPVYLQSTTSSSIPEMRRVIVVYGDKLTMAETLEAGLKDIFGRNAPALSALEEVPQEEPEENQGGSESGKPDVSELLSQIKQIREMLDSLENQLTNLTNPPNTNLPADQTGSPTGQTESTANPSGTGKR
jgi:uncharacterized membrane protein (UPF0182 family)